MVENVNFKEVTTAVRFQIFGQFDFLTPSQFEKLTKAEQLHYYAKVFDLFHDACTFLSANLDMDKLMNKYSKEKPND